MSIVWMFVLIVAWVVVLDGLLWVALVNRIIRTERALVAVLDHVTTTTATPIPPELAGLLPVLKGAHRGQG